MEKWKQLANVIVDVPVRSAGNTVINHSVSFEVFKDSTMYKAVAQCSEEQKRLGQIKDEILFYFRPDKAVAEGGVKDGNQHIVESIGLVLKEKNLAP